MVDLFGGYDALFGWGEMGVRSLAPHVDVLIVVDVLSFSTAVDIAVARGATVYPYRFRDASAQGYADSLGATLASYWRESTDEKPFSLSPSSLTGIPPGAKLVLPSPNGATISAVAREAGVQVLCGCLRNAAAVAQAAAALGSRIGVIAAGERWPDGSLRPALEDLVGSGAILSYLPPSSLSPDARAAIAACQAADMATDIAACPSGQELIQAGFSQDVVLATQLNASTAVPELQEGFANHST